MLNYDTRCHTFNVQMEVKPYVKQLIRSYFW